MQGMRPPRPLTRVSPAAMKRKNVQEDSEVVIREVLVSVVSSDVWRSSWTREMRSRITSRRVDARSPRHTGHSRKHSHEHDADGEAWPWAGVETPVWLWARSTRGERGTPAIRGTTRVSVSSGRLRLRLRIFPRPPGGTPRASSRTLKPRLRYQLDLLYDLVHVYELYGNGCGFSCGYCT